MSEFVGDIADVSGLLGELMMDTATLHSIAAEKKNALRLYQCRLSVLRKYQGSGFIGFSRARLLYECRDSRRASLDIAEAIAENVATLAHFGVSYE
ncbi:MAG: hypothetical protein ACRC2U_19525 [Aeromonas sp.]